MKIHPLCLALALTAFALPCAAQQHAPRAETCTDTITGNPSMSREMLWAAERETNPDPADRADYRLLMLQERMGAWQRESRRMPTQLGDFTDVVPEVPWLSTCDPWHHRIRFTARGDEFDLRSAGPDGAFDTADDRARTGFFERAAGRGAHRDSTAAATAP